MQFYNVKLKKSVDVEEKDFQVVTMKNGSGATATTVDFRYTFTSQSATFAFTSNEDDSTFECKAVHIAVTVTSSLSVPSNSA